MKMERNSRYSLVFLVLMVLGPVVPGWAQFQFQNPDPDAEAGAIVAGGPQLGESRKQAWRTGITIEPQAPMQDITVTLPLPMDWPEQKVLSVTEESLANAKIRYRTVNGGAKEAVLEIDKTRSARKIELVLVVNLLNYELIAPENTEDYIIPKRPPRGLEAYVKDSPDIKVDNRILKMFHEITKDRPSDWDKVEALYSYVQSNVRYEGTLRNKEARGAQAVISDPEGTWYGDCKDMCCLFVALCRAGKIPARVVRVPEHCYAEFYLELKPEKTPKTDTERRRGAKPAAPTGFWFPCQVAGTYAFGGIPERQPILQKGDAFPDREKGGRHKKMFLNECFEGNSIGENPKYKWIKEVQEVKGE